MLNKMKWVFNFLLKKLQFFFSLPAHPIFGGKRDWGGIGLPTDYIAMPILQENMHFSKI